MKTQLFNQSTITIIPQTNDNTVCFANEKYMNTLFTGISDKNTRAFIVTDNKIQSDDKTVYITPETITSMKFNPVKYLKSEMDIVTFCMGFVKQSESEISDTIKANENMYTKLKRLRKAAAFALATAIICIKIFNKSTGDADLLKAFDLIKECKDDEHMLLEYVQEVENIKENSSVSYYWSLFMELCDNNVDTYRKIMNAICLGTECYLSQRIANILSADDGLVDNFTSKPQKKMIIMAASNQDHEILDNKTWQIFIFMYSYCIKTTLTRTFLPEKVYIVFNESWNYADALYYILHPELSGVKTKVCTNLIIRNFQDIKHVFSLKWGYIKDRFNIQFICKNNIPDKNTIALLKEVILKFSGAKNKIPYRIIKLMEVIKSAEKNPDTIYGLLIEQNKGIHFGNSEKPETKMI